jgi:hypothetical protein
MPMNLKNLPPVDTRRVTAWMDEVCRLWRHNMLQLGQAIRPYLLREQATLIEWTEGEAVFQKTVAITELF